MENNSTSTRLSALTRKLAVGCIFVSSTFAFGQFSRSTPFDNHGEGRHKGCSNGTLNGDYGIQIEGAHDGASLRTLVLAYFDGDHTITEVDHVVFNGQPPQPEDEWRPTTGTYNINPDCTGSAKVEVAPGADPLSYHFIVVNHGQKFILVVDGGAINGVAYKVD